MKPERALFTYIGKVENGKLRVYNSETMKRDIQDFFDGREVQVMIETLKIKRSNKQNRYYWGCIVKIIRAELYRLHGVQYDIDEVHAFLKDRFNSDTLINEDTGELIRIPKSTGKLSTSQMEEYHERIRQWSEEFLGVVIPKPNEQAEINFND